MSTVTLKLGTSTARLDMMRNRVFAGRDPQACALAFLDPALSRRHAEVWLENGQTYIRDLGSSNGTWVDGQLVGAHPVLLRAGQRVFLGTVPLGVEWEAALGGGATQMVAMPDELKALIEARKAQMAAGGSMSMPAQQMAPPAPMPMQPMHMMQPPPSGMMQAPQAQMMQAPMSGVQMPAPSAQPAGNALGVGGQVAPIPSSLAYRRQGSNNNGVLLIALSGDTFSNAAVIEGYVEFTAMDNENVASISVELVEFHKKGPGEGHVWDRVLVRQGPWKTKKGDVLPLPFQLRVPPGTSISGREVIWEIRGLVDINWAVDIDCVVPINMRNTDVERIRDALGSLDYRIVELESAPLGQRFFGKFQPPANLRSEWGINDIEINVEYLGANLQVHMHIDKKGVFKFDKDVKQLFELARLRSAPMPEVVAHIKKQIDEVMQR
jgi:hypothetical protein